MEQAFDIAMKVLNIPIEISGYTFTFLQLFVFAAVLSVLLIILFRSFK